MNHGHPADFRALMAGFPTGVTIVTTTGTEGDPWGMTLTSLCSVSMEPPVLLVCMRRGSPTLDAALARRSFAVNLLHRRARSTAELFASGAPDRFDRVAWHAPAGTGGPHLLEAAHAVADCAVTTDQVVGDHVVIMGRVTRVTRLAEEQHPLLYGLRRFATWPDTDDQLSYDFIS
ncbi:flavin reductase family protein [Streptomyces griseoviridis]|uniref:flavin reductase family protein n=1 Tax=Streptomyces TaxID=1883 RepID=UPI002475EACE|nr:flavin reductase family protein [Streptomyces sp. MAA16]MDH6696262.1 flavin reductase (DIM6/NTAB) family NADH-FMN oxidoreductase RutF [Streptomyces sp. MAA16]